MVLFCAIHLLATQYIAAQKSKGDILVFQRRSSITRKRRSFISNRKSNSEPSTRFAQDINKLQNQDDQDDQDDHDDSKKGISTASIQPTPKQSTIFHWKNLSYDVKTKDGTKRILDNVNGWVKPGTLTALIVRATFPSPWTNITTTSSLISSP